MKGTFLTSKLRHLSMLGISTQFSLSGFSGKFECLGLDLCDLTKRNVSKDKVFKTQALLWLTLC